MRRKYATLISLLYQSLCLCRRILVDKLKTAQRPTLYGRSFIDSSVKASMCETPFILLQLYSIKKSPQHTAMGMRIVAVRYENGVGYPLRRQTK